MKFKYIVVYENNSESILGLSDQGQGHGATLKIFSINCNTNFQVP